MKKSGSFFNPVKILTDAVRNGTKQKGPFSRHLFWDVDRSTLDFDFHKTFIIERILRYGLPKDVLWLLKTYSENDVIAVVKKSKNIDKKTANFWTIHLNIHRNEVLCLNRPLIQEQFY